MFGVKVRKMRKEKNLRQSDLAEILSVSRSAVSNWENNKGYPDILTIIEIANYFNVSLDYLLKEDVDMVSRLDSEIKKGRFFLKWYIELFLFVVSFFCVSFLMNTILNLEFNVVSELFVGMVFYLVFKWLNKRK